MFEVIAEHGQTLVIIACVFGFFMAWGIGANDVANAMGTSVGARALTVGQAVMLACIFEFAGAYLAGGEVTSTIRKGIIDTAIMEGSPELLVFGMLGSLLAAGIWLLVASYFGWPVSTTHSIVGAIVGFAAVGIGVDTIQWPKVTSIAASWVVSPVVAGVISFLLFTSVKKLILQRKNPFMSAKRYVPFYMFLSAFLIAMVTFLKGLKHVGIINFTASQSIAWSLVFALIITLFGTLLLQRVDNTVREKNGTMFDSVERIFSILMVFTACSMAFAHGSNDVANAIGPLAAIISVVQSGGMIAAESTLPPWVLLIGACGIVIGLAMLGFRVMMTVGRAITELTPSHGFAAELAAAGTVVIASGTGIPVSTTHTLVGAVIGVGLAKGIGAINLRVVGKIILSWIVTLPVGAGLSILFFYALKGFFT